MPSSYGVGVAAGEGWTPTAFSERRDATVGYKIGRVLIDIAASVTRFTFGVHTVEYLDADKSAFALSTWFPWRLPGAVASRYSQARTQPSPWIIRVENFPRKGVSSTPPLRHDRPADAISSRHDVSSV